MASPAAVQPEATYLSPDSAAQVIAQDYSNQWHILEQLKSSVTVVDPQIETNNQQNTTLTPRSTTETAENTPQEDKADGKQWYVLPDAVSSGHSSETEGDSALEDVSYISNKSTSLKSKSQDKEYPNKDSLYHEQWHVLEELKASVKAMQWSSDSSLDVSNKQETQSRTSSKNGDFVEPHKRTPAGSVNLTSSSIGSSGSRESGVRSTVPSYVSQSHHSQVQSPLDVQFYSGTSITSDQPDIKNTSSDLSLESENLGFAELPNRPATIGNYGASDGLTYPFNTGPLPPQPLTVNMASPQNSQYNASVVPVVGPPLFPVPENAGDSSLSKTPISARERLQPDGRDGPDVMTVPPTAQTIPSLVSYPLSGSLSQNSSGTASQPLFGSGFNGSMTNGALMGDSDVSQSNLVANTVDNNTPSGSQTQTPTLAQFTYDPGSNSSMENVKGAQPTFSSPWQPDVNSPSLHCDVTNSTSITWLSSAASASHALVPGLPGNDSGSRRSSITHEELREAVLQRIEAHTQIPGLSSSRDLNNQTQSDSGRLSAPPFVGNNQDFPETNKSTSRPHSYQEGFNSPRDLYSSGATSEELVTASNYSSSLVMPRDSSSRQATPKELVTSTKTYQNSGVMPRDSSSRPATPKELVTSTKTYQNRGVMPRDSSSRPATPKELVAMTKTYQNSGVLSRDSVSRDVSPKELSSDRSNLSGTSISYSRHPDSLTSRTGPLTSLQNNITSSGYSTYLPLSTSTTYPTEQFTTTTYSDKSIGEYKTYPLPNVSSAVPVSTTFGANASARPSVLNTVKTSHLTNNDYGQSPVSKLLGPHFKSTQEYLSRLKNDRLGDSSLESTSSSVKMNQDGRETEQRPYGSFSHVSSLSDDSYKPLKEAWSDERSYTHKQDSYNLEGSGREQSPLARSFQHEMVSGTSVSTTRASMSFTYSNSMDHIRGTSANELSSDSGRGLDSTGLYPKSFADTTLLSRSSYAPTIGSDLKYTDVYRGSDVYLKSMDHLLGSKAPLSAIQLPNAQEIQLRYTDQQENEPFTKPLAMTDSEPPHQTSVASASSNIPIQRGQYLVPRGEGPSDVNKSSFSSYETPLSSLRPDQKTWEGEGRNLRYSRGSSGVLSHDEAEDTDDLLSYEAALESDIKYFRNLTENAKNYHSSSVNSKTEGPTPSHLSGEISAISGTLDRDPLRRIPASASSTGLDFTNSDELTKRYHLSLGAGEVRPVEDYRKPLGTLEGKVDYRTPVGILEAKDEYRQPVGIPEGEDSDVALSSDELEVEEYGENDKKKESYYSDRNTSPGTESSSSNLYQPYLPIALRQPPSTERDSELTGNSSSTFGVYDIRQSSGPGSTNRRRKAMGLSPIPGRVPNRASNSIVYVSGDSSPLSMPEDEKTIENQHSRDDTSRDTSKESLGNGSAQYHSERSQSSSRSSRHLEAERPRSSSKEGSYRSRSRTSSFEEAKMIDDYIGGRKAIPHGKQKPKSSRSRNASQSDESQSSREFTSNSKDLNQMWERFQESLRLSPRSKHDDSVSSHLSRLSALLSKPIDVIATSSEAESEQFRKPRSHSYASSSSDVSTESDQPYNPQSYSLTRKIQLRKLLETVNIADIPTFPRLRHRDTTTTSSTLSDTSTSEAPVSKHNNTSITRANRGSRKVSKTPVLEPFVQTKPRSANTACVKPKCICSIKSVALEPKPLQDVIDRKTHGVVDRKVQRPHTVEVGINFPSPKVVSEKKLSRTKKGCVDVGVQTRQDSDDDSLIHTKRKNDSEKRHHRDRATVHEKAAQTSSSEKVHRRKERPIVSQNSPGKSPRQSSPSRTKERHIASRNFSKDSTRSSDDDGGLLNGWDDSHELNRSRKDKSRDKHHKDRSHQSRSALDTSGPVWFYPVSNRHYSRPSTKPTIQPDKLRYDEQTVNTFSPPAAPPSTSMQKLSLQDAFFFAKPDFIKRSRARISRLNHNMSVRENGESKSMGQDRVSKMEIPASKAIVNKPPTDPRTEKLHRPKPRQISKKEMKTMNLKLYNKLPEVKAKKADDKRVNFYKTNRIRAKLFDKRVRDNLKKRYAA